MTTENTSIKAIESPVSLVSSISKRFNPFAPVGSSSSEHPQINWTPGMPRRYSSDRKEGCIKRRSGGETYNEGRSLDMVVVLPLPLFTGQMFNQVTLDGSPKIDTWASIGFVDIQNTPSVIMISDGTTEALRPWLEYQQDMESSGIPIGSVITTLSFRPFKNGRGHSYVFTFRNAKTKEEKNKIALVEEWMMKDEPIVYEPTIEPYIIKRLLKQMGFSEAEIATSSPRMANSFSSTVDKNEFDDNGELILTEEDNQVALASINDVGKMPF